MIASLLRVPPSDVVRGFQDGHLDAGLGEGAQMGSTIAIGLLMDTLIVRSLLMPSIATLLGRWFWWPQVVYPRGDNHFLKPQPPRPPSDDPDTVALPAQV